MENRIKSLIYQVNNYTLSRPRLYDFLIKLKRLLQVKSSPLDRFLNTYSKGNKRNINFVQIGASDGLRNDPIRQFVIRDNWRGVLVEPIPYVFEILKKNYEYVSNPGLIFVNAAIVESNTDNMKFYTIREEFLHKLPLERRLSLLRKSSFLKENVEKFSQSLSADPSQAISAMEIQCTRLKDLIERYFHNFEVDFFSLDAEGYDATIIRNMFDIGWYPKTILFEALHMGAEKDNIYDLFREKGYKINEFTRDTVATLESY